MPYAIALSVNNWDAIIRCVSKPRAEKKGDGNGIMSPERIAFKRRIGLVVTLVVTAWLGAWAYYCAAWRRSANSTWDDRCAERLKVCITALDTYRLKWGMDVPQPGFIVPEPFECPKEPHPTYNVLPGGIIVCRNHREPRPGWNLRYDEGGLVALPGGEIRRLEASEIERLINLYQKATKTTLAPMAEEP